MPTTRVKSPTSAGRIEITVAHAKVCNSKHSELDEHVPQGARFDVISISRDKNELPWYRVTLPGGKDGYISDDDADLQRERVIVDDVVPIYEAKDLNSPVRFELKKGERIGMWRKQDSFHGSLPHSGWLEIECSHGMGFMKGTVVHEGIVPTISEAPSAISTIITSVAIILFLLFIVGGVLFFLTGGNPYTMSTVLGLLLGYWALTRRKR